MAEVRPLTVRGPMLPFSLDLDIEGFTLVSWELPPYRLARWLPPGLELAERDAEHGRVAYLSVFVGRNVVRRIGGLPAFPFRIPQLNYRTYVRTADGPALFIFRSIVGAHPLGRGLRLLPALSGEVMDFSFALDDDEEPSVEVKVGRDGDELAFRVSADQGLQPIRGFASPEEAIRFLGDVRDALYPQGEDTVGLMLSQHPPLAPVAGHLRDPHFNWLIDRGILTPLEARYPLCTLFQRDAPFPVQP
ncbi:MAG: DUF2071 domain-containing protein [Candidatus Sericytochromatia bacterium]|nr:DUF2071 domain-containing protein [Candidatus Tanganyikabacteria bacterium]